MLTYLQPCPTGPSTTTHLLLPPTTTSTAPPTVATCTCEPEFCTLDYPQGCYCQNDVKKRCYERCGGPEPAYLVRPLPSQYPRFPSHILTTHPQSCPALPTSTFQTSTRRPPPTTTSTRLPKPTPVPTNDICGGGRANYLLCDKGYICINNPFASGCGLECDATGICVSERGCGGFAGTPCPDSRQICVDDPRDDCVAEEGGRDCIGLCMFK
jgi:hypothetical protein